MRAVECSTGRRPSDATQPVTGGNEPVGKQLTGSFRDGRKAVAALDGSCVMSPLSSAGTMDAVKILVAYDGGLAARRALYKAAQLARATHAPVGVISVVPLYRDRGRPTIEPWDDRGRHRGDLEEAQAVFNASGIEAELIEVVGNPAERINAVAEDRGYDTIVLGARRKGWLDRLLTGSVMGEVLERVSASAAATVVLVP